MSTKDGKRTPSRPSGAGKNTRSPPTGSDDEFTAFIQMAGHLMRSVWAGYSRTGVRPDILGWSRRGLAAMASGLGGGIRKLRAARAARKAASAAARPARTAQATTTRPSTLAEKYLTELKLLHTLQEARGATDPLAAQRARDIGRVIEAAADPSVMAALILTQDHRSPEVRDAVRLHEDPSRRPRPYIAPIASGPEPSPALAPLQEPGSPSSGVAKPAGPDIEELRERLTRLHRDQAALANAIPAMAASAAVTARVLGVIDRPGVAAAIHASGDHTDPQVLAAVIAAETDRQPAVSPARPATPLPEAAPRLEPEPKTAAPPDDWRRRLTELHRDQVELGKAVPAMAEAATLTARVLNAIDDPKVAAAIHASGDHADPRVLAAVTAAETSRQPMASPAAPAMPGQEPAPRADAGVKLRVTRRALGPALGL